jgi:hypothetical protein
MIIILSCYFAEKSQGQKNYRKRYFQSCTKENCLLIIFDYMIVEGTKEEVISDKIYIRLDFSQQEIISIIFTT